MTRTLRAAELSAATVALFAGVSFAAPSFADTGGPLPGQQPAASAAAPKGYLAALYEKAAAAFGFGEAAAPAAAPQKSLAALVDEHEADSAPDGEEDCLAKAVYFESRGEPIEGQLAVAEVVLNRAASGRYPTSLCQVITQPAQFSFIRHGHFPTPDEGSQAWRKAVAIAKIARDRIVSNLPSDVLWYHAEYVAPSWAKHLDKTAQIGLHIFYS